MGWVVIGGYNSGPSMKTYTIKCNIRNPVNYLRFFFHIKICFNPNIWKDKLPKMEKPTLN